MIDLTKPVRAKLAIRQQFWISDCRGQPLLVILHLNSSDMLADYGENGNYLISRQDVDMDLENYEPE